MKNYALALVLSLLVMLLLIAVGAQAADISFSNLVPVSSIATQECGNTSTIASIMRGTS